MPPKKPATLARDDTSLSESTTGLQREARIKRGANYRDYQDEMMVAIAPTVCHLYSEANEQFDIDSLSLPSLRKYRKVHKVSTTLDTLPIQDNPTQAPRRYLRIEKEEELVGAVKRHWAGAQIKENDAIVSFLYAARNEDKTFKMRFVP